MFSENLSAEAGQAEFADVIGWLELAELEPIPGSYCDLMIMKGQHS
jgi:hypothetical protein